MVGTVVVLGALVCGVVVMGGGGLDVGSGVVESSVGMVVVKQFQLSHAIV